MFKKITTKFNHLNNLLMTLFLLPEVSFATESKVTLVTVLETITKFLTGDLARSAGVLAIVGAGYMFLIANRIEKETFMKIAVAMSIILGAPTLYETVVGA